VVRFKRLPVDHDGVAAGEPRPAVIGINARGGVAMLMFLRDGSGEGALERHESGPVQPDIAGDALVVHASGMIDRGCATNKNLLGVAPAQ